MAKRNPITDEQVKACYEAARAIKDDELGATEAQHRISKETGMNENTAGNYLKVIRAILAREQYTTTMKAWATQLVLEWIKRDDGPKAQHKAAKVVLKHVEDSPFGHPQREVLRVAEEILGYSSSDEVAKMAEKLEKQVKEAGDLPPEELEAKARETGRAKPATRMAPAKSYERSPYVKAHALKRAGGICEHCEKPAPFNRPDGTPYLEVHHKRPLAEDGPDTIKNAIALCPNCHREAHFGQEWRKFR